MGRTYRLQIGYSDGTVAMVFGQTDPGCAGRLEGNTDTIVRGPEGLGVYGVAMAAFGKQYAEAFATAPEKDLVCPADPRDPGTVEVDGASTALDTGYRSGRRLPMAMPLTAIRGIECTWLPGAAKPTVRTLSPEQAERVRIGLHAIDHGVVDCMPSPSRPTITAVVEDKTGTRRAVTIVEAECSTVIHGDDELGLGFTWLAH